MKLLVRLAIGLVLLVVLAGAGVAFYADTLVARAVAEGGTRALGAETRLESASIGLFSGRFALKGLEVANPPGFAEPCFFSLGATELELPLSTLLEPRITIPSLVLEGITIDLERNDSGTNFGPILEHIRQLQSGQETGGGEAGGATKEPEGGGKTFLLQRLVIREARATASLLPLPGQPSQLSLTIPEIVVEHIDSEMDLEGLCALVVRTVVEAALKSGSGALPEVLLADLRGRVADLEDSARGALDEKMGELESRLSHEAGKLGPEGEEAAQKALEKAKGAVGDSLDGLLKKKKKD